MVTQVLVPAPDGGGLHPPLAALDVLGDHLTNGDGVRRAVGLAQLLQFDLGEERPGLGLGGEGAAMPSGIVRPAHAIAAAPGAVPDVDTVSILHGNPNACSNS